jgi:predicted acylesterase/phospholipase RssA
MGVRTAFPLKPLVLAVLACTSGLGSGCSTLPRAPAPLEAAADAAAPAGLTAGVRFLGIDPESFDRRARASVAALRSSADGGPVNVLALSGGGAGGSFGAGALIGMSQRGERPEFHVVTGVSVGALLAPFAFLGTGWDDELLAAFADGRLAKLLKIGGPAILFRSSIYAGAPLRAYVDRFVTPQLIDAVADEAARGKLLFVATTDLDKQETVIWDLGVVAAGRSESARTLFRDVLVASASIPGVFPPVLIRVSDGEREYEEMHVDGGTTVPFLVAPEISQLDAGRVLDLQGGRIFVLVNGSLSARPLTTPARAVPVISRGFSATMMHGSRRTISLAAEFARRQEMELKFTYLPATYPYRGALAFDADELRQLFEFGRRCAAHGELWTRTEVAVEEGSQSVSAGVSTDLCPAPLDRKAL